MGLSHWCTVVLSRTRWCTPYLHPKDHLHRDRLYLIGWNSALGSALMQGNRGGIWGGLVWPGSSLSVRPSHWHLSGLLRQGCRIQHLFWLIHPNWRETPPLGLLVSHHARAAPSATVLGWVEQATAIKHSNGVGKQMNPALGEIGIETQEFHHVMLSNSQRDQVQGKLHRHSAYKNRQAWRSPGISQTNWHLLDAMQRLTSWRIPPFWSNQTGAVPSSSRCWHPGGAASSDLLT